MSGSQFLFSALNDTSRIQGISFNASYSSPLVLMSLLTIPHKNKTKAAVYMDQLNFNLSLTCKNFYDLAKFIYIVREPRATLNMLVENEKYSELSACRYYCFRLRRLFEMKRKTPLSPVLTWDDICSGKKNEEISEYLNLKEPLNLKVEEFKPSIERVSYDTIRFCDIAYEYYLHRMRS